MYYESRIHTKKEFTSVADMVKAMQSGEVSAHHALVVPSLNLMIVADMPDSFGEAAIMNTAGEKIEQVESLTLAWVHPAEWEQQILICFDNPQPMGKAQIQFEGQVNKSAKAWFTCGCCGEGFKGVIVEQLKYDQDNGFGICVKCEKYYK